MTEFDSKSNGGSKFDDDDLQKASQHTDSQWLKVRKENQYLVSHVDTLVLFDETLKCKVRVLETLVAKKESKLKEVSLELERTQKSLKMLNSDTSKLEHILTMGKSNRDQRGLGFVGETSGSKTVFVKGSNSQNVATSMPYVKTNVIRQ